MAGGEARDAGPRPAAAGADSPLSHAQERLWFLDQLAPGNPFYNVPVVVRLRGEPRVAALAGALRQVARRHQALCTSFPAVAGRPAPRIDAGTWSRLPVVDLGGLPAAPRRAEGEALAAREAARPFDLESGPVARASLLRLGESEHLLLLTLHHIVADGWSIGVLVREAGALYRAAVLGAAPELPELPIQYADFARWQRQWLAGEAGARQLGYWRERLADLPALDLPLDRRRPAAQRCRGSGRRVTVGAETVAGLRRLGRERGATLFMSVLAGFGALLGRWSRQREVVVGSPIAGRTRGEVEGLIGVFVNSLVLRLDVGGEGGEGGFGDLVSRVREVALGAYAHQDLPFAKLVEELQPQRDPSRNPLFQVVFALRNAPVPPLALPGLELALLPLDDETATFDLELDLWEQEGELRGALRFDRDLFDGATVRRMGEQLSRLLSAAAAAPGLRPAELPLLSPAERQMVLVEWNGLAADAADAADQAADQAADPSGGGGDLVARFRRQVERTPGATAVVCDAAGWSYAELWERALRVGARLRALGAGPGARVGVCLERSLELVAALLGVLEAGAAYVPLDPSYPEERSSWVLGDSGVGWVLAAGALAARVRGHGAWQVVELEDGWASAATTADGRGAAAAAGPDLDRSELPAYVIYTSGSTGRPKGVVVPHRAVARLFTSTAGWFGFSAADVWTLFHSAAFDFSVWELWGALLHGGRLVVVPYWVSRSPESFHRLLLEQGVTVLSQTPSAWVQLLARMAAAGEAPPALRWVVFGGEALEPSSLERWWGLGSAATLVNMYGITETTVHVTYRPWREAAPGSRIGVPLPDLAVYVVSAGGALAPLGGLGELWVGGAGVAHGYLDRPELTAERFAPEPWSGKPGARAYRSGDLGRWTAAGDLEYLGRIDQQVKVRGYRIELGEIESVLREHGGVREVAVVLREDSPGDRRLTAYVVPEAAGGEAGGGEAGGWQAEQVSRWREVFDETYRREGAPEGAAPEPALNLAGWRSVETGEAIPAAQMREWVEETVGALAARGPRRVLEIGCGTGLLLLRLARECERYTGTDVSGEALAYVAAQVAAWGEHGRGVRLLARPADDVTGLADDGAFDAVVLNSVVQYFPDVDYLERTLRGAVSVVAPGGFVYVGDVRSLPLLGLQHLGMELGRMEAGAPLARLERRVRQQVSRETELALSPECFVALASRLPRIAGVEVVPKQGSWGNELSKYRYQVVLRVGDGSAPRRTSVPDGGGRWLDWRRESLSLAGLRELLERTRPEELRVGGVPNARLRREVAAWRALTGEPPPATVGELGEQVERALAAGAVEGVEPAALAALGRELGYQVGVGWSRPGAEGRLDVVFRAGDAAAAEEDRGRSLVDAAPERVEGAPAAYANDPRQGAFARRFGPSLRQWAEARLPGYMVPSALVVLDALPLTPQGKLDRRSLPAPEPLREPPAGGWATPASAVEASLARILAQVLGIERVGRADDFFQLGGHSLLATQAVSLMRSELGVEVALRWLFESPTVAALAPRIEAALRARSGEGGAVAPPIVPAAREGPVPLSFAQRRLWFLDQLRPGSPVYNVPAPLRIAGRLDRRALSLAVGEVVRRHAALRTSFPVAAGGEEACQWVHAPAAGESWRLPLVDLGALAAPRAWAEARGLLRADAARPFDLAAAPPAAPAGSAMAGTAAPAGTAEGVAGLGAPLLRVALLRLGDDEQVMLFDVHHIVFDGWSLAVWRRELAALYGAYASGAGSPLPEPAIQYADYALWQRRHLSGEALAAQLRFWRERLAGAPPVLELPADRARPAVQSFRGRAVRATAPAALAGDLAGRCRREGVTPFMLLLAAFEALLGRHSGRADLLVGTPVANRTREELEPLIGFFANTLALRGRPAPEAAFGELLRQAREMALAAYAHQDLPFEALVEELAPARDLSRNPLVQVVLALPGPAEQAVPSPPGLGWSALPAADVGFTAAKFDLALVVEQGPGGATAGGELSLALEVAADLFDAASAARLLGHFMELLAGAVAAPEARIAELPLLSVAERHQLLTEWNDTRAAPERAPVDRLFAARARRAPDVVAVVDGSRCLSYGELDRRAAALARRLREVGAGPGSLVGLCVERSAELVVGALAALAAGSAYVPLDPGQPDERLAFMLADAAPAAVLGSAASSARLRGLARQRLVLVEIAEIAEVAEVAAGGVGAAAAATPATPATPAIDAAGEPPIAEGEPGAGEAPAWKIGPEDRAYVIYTSGSTGTPKGVEVCHGALSNLVCWHRARYGASPGERASHLAGLSFDATMVELWPHLAAGRSVQLAPEAVRHDPEALRDWLLAEQVTIGFAPTPMAELLIALAWPRQPPLRVLMTGGDTLHAGPPPGLPFALDNGYGPTENAVVTTSGWARPERPATGRAPSIGRPLPNVEVVLLGRAGEPVPIGVAGELHAGGESLARGYLGRPELTAERFVPHPFAARPGARLYRTGDLARQLASGEIEFLGRLDAQVKVRGHRVEPAEVEAALAAHPRVRQAVVLARDESGGGRRLAACVVAEGAVTAGELRAFLRGRLPEAMVPSSYVQLPGLPLTSSGKVDRRACARLHLETAATAAAATPEGPETTGEAARTPPRTPLEELLAGMWAKLLELPAGAVVGVEEDFFDLGGHSLLATRLVSRLRTALGVELGVQALFEARTLGALAAVVAAAVRGEGGWPAPLPPIVPAAREGPVPLSFAQRRLWFLDQLRPGSPVYNIPAPLRIAGRLDRRALSLAVGEVVRRHAALRTSFPVAAGGEEACQCVHAPAAGESWRLPLVDLGALAGPRAWAETRGLLRADAARPFDLAAAAPAAPAGSATAGTAATAGSAMAATAATAPMAGTAEGVAGLGAPLLRVALLRLGDDEQVMLFDVHHIVFDGWSLAVWRRELAALYGAYASGAGSPLPEPAIQYADYALWQRRHLSGEALAAQLRFWRERLAGAPPVLELPADRARPAVQSFRGRAVRATAPAALAADLAGRCRREGVTPFMLLLAAFEALLGRHSGRADLLVGTPVANRTREELEPLIGFFANTLALRGRPAPEAAFGELLRQAREMALAAYAHQDLPFEALVEELAPARDLSRNPLVQVVLALPGPAEQAVPSPPGLAFTALPLAELGLTIAKFDLTLAACGVPGAGGGGRAVAVPGAAGRAGAPGAAGGGGDLWFELEVAADLFDAGEAARLLGHFVELLAGAVADPGLRLAELPLLSVAERHQLLTEWNDTGAWRASAPVDRLFAARARRAPDAVAVVDGSRCLSYGELDRRAAALARRLREVGAGPGSLVGLCVERSAELVAGALAALAAGSAYVALDPGQPDERLAFMLADAAPAAVLASAASSARLRGLARQRLVVVEVAAGGAAGAGGAGGAGATIGAAGEPPIAAGEPGAGEAPAWKIGPEDRAYVIYTSGSTGTPKGVEVSHGALSNLVSWYAGRFGPGPGERASHAAGLSFDATILELWPHLAAGGSVHLAPEPVRHDPEALRDWLLAEQVTIGFAATPMAELLVALAWPRQAPLRVLLTGGDMLHAGPPPGLPFALDNCYGPTESAVVTTSGWTEPASTAGPRAPAIGRPLPNVEVVLLGRAGDLVPMGAPGELCTGGASLARGYLGRPELTAERFVPHPFAARPGARLYRTGDLARQLATGEIEFLGRSDRQVKIRGWRIEPGEVEAALAALPGLRESVVAVDRGGDGGARLVAYVVGDAGRPPRVEELRAALKRRLPEPLVPALFVTLAALPRDASGKLDRKALPAPPAVGEISAVAPRGPVEELVAGIWAEIFGRDAIGAHDDFFELGGHSLLAMRAAMRLRAALGVELPLQWLFEAPTVAALARLLVTARREAAIAAAPPIFPRRRVEALPLSFAQQRIWLVSCLEADSPIFNLPTSFRLDGLLDPAALGAALTEVVRRHEALRTIFMVRAGQPLQVVLPPPSRLRLPLVDLGGCPAAGRRAAARSLAERETRMPFDLARGPLLRAALVRLAPDDYLLLLTLHHIVVDGWSTEILQRELAALYGACRGRRASPLAAPALQYSDYALWQRGWMRGAVLDGALARWRERFGGRPLPVLRLPAGRPAPPAAAPAEDGRRAGDCRERVLGGELAAGARALGRRAGATLFMVLLAGFDALLHRLCGEETIAVGTPVAGRGRAELEDVVGCFVNTVVLPVDCGGDPSFEELLSRVRETAFAAYALDELPFEKLVEALQPERRRGATPLFQVMFALQGDPGETPEAAGVRFSPLPLGNGTAQFDLTLYLAERSGGLVAYLEYSSARFDGATVGALLAAYEELLAAAVAAPATPLSRLPVPGELAWRGEPEPAAVAAQSSDSQAAFAERRQRLASRRARLSAEQRAALARRTEGGG